MNILSLVPLKAWIALAALVAIGGVYKVGERHGYQKGQTEQLRASVEAFKNRQGVDDETRNLDDRALCLRLGGVPEQCR